MNTHTVARFAWVNVVLHTGAHEGMDRSTALKMAEIAWASGAEWDTPVL